MRFTGLVCRRVDDETALAVFTNPAAARAALEASGGSYVMRPFSEVRLPGLVTMIRKFRFWLWAGCKA